MPRSLMLFAIVFLLAGCSPPAPIPAFTPMPAPTQAPLPESEWTIIRMNHSGGIMGLSRSVEISSDGAYVVADDRMGKTIKGKLPANELSELNKLVAAAKFLEGTEAAICADCFIYDIKIQGSGKNIGAQLNDITLSASGMESLVAYLRNLIERALKSA